MFTYTKLAICVIAYITLATFLYANNSYYAASGQTDLAFIGATLGGIIPAQLLYVGLGAFHK